MVKELDRRYQHALEEIKNSLACGLAEIISENIKLKRENIKLKRVQGETALELAALREENEKLKTKRADKDIDLLKLNVQGRFLLPTQSKSRSDDPVKV